MRAHYVYVDRHPDRHDARRLDGESDWGIAAVAATTVTISGAGLTRSPMRWNTEISCLPGLQEQVLALRGDRR